MSRHRNRARRGKASSGRYGPAYPTLDLHGLTRDEAELAAERWLRSHQAEGELVVRLITGRGLHSPGPPILPRIMEDLLSGLRGTVIERFEPESAGGAFTVWLSRTVSHRPKTPRRPTAWSPDLVREAEEALAELGIQPTPPIVEAEMRRILQERGREAG